MAPGRAGVGDFLFQSQVRLGYLGTFSCKPREIGKKVPYFFPVGLNAPSQFLSA